MSTEPEYSFGSAELRKMSTETRKMELDFKRRQADEELRRWCVEQIGSSYIQAADRIEQAEALYTWVRNQPKADPEAYLKKLKADAA